MLMLRSFSTSARSRAPQQTMMRTRRVRMSLSTGLWTEKIPFAAASTLTFSEQGQCHHQSRSTSFTPHTAMYSTMATAIPSKFHSRRPSSHLHSPTNSINNSIDSISLQDPHNCTAVRTRVFVSKHNQSMNVTGRDILDYFSSHGISTHDARSTASHVILKECPFCSKSVNNKADNMYKCYVQIGGGAYFCHRCGAGGSWYDLKKTFGGFQVSGLSGSGSQPSATTMSPRGSSRQGQLSAASSSPKQRAGVHNATAMTSVAADDPANQKALNEFMKAPPQQKKETDCLPMPSPRLQACYNTQLLDQKQTPNATLDYLKEERGLNVRTLRKYGVGSAKYNFRTDAGAWEATECVTFPWLMSVKDVQFQENLRGATYEWKDSNPTTDVASTKKDAVVTKDDEGNKTEGDTKTKEDKKAKDDKEVKAKKGKVEKSEEAEAIDPREETFLTRRIKVRALANKAWQRLDPPGGGWGLFGFHTVPRDAKEIVLTEGEYDAMAVWQATGLPAVSLPNGCRSLPVEVLPQLERFEKIYLWMDNDTPGQDGADLFAKKIGLERCHIVRPTKAICGETLPKDANEALLEGMDLTKMIQDSKPVPHERILTFDELRSDVLHEIMYPDKYVGVPMSSLPGLTSIIKGFRRGELTVITGSTGSGKTTFLSQMSLDMAEQDVNVLWGSFEIKNTRLMHKLLQQHAREPLPVGDPSKAEQLDHIADKFATLPLHFMKFHGGSDVSDVLDAMDYAVYVNDTEHIILDNMQFMISRSSSGNSTFDKFDVQDMAIEKFRKFATDRNVHVTLVVHPRKEQEDSKLSMSSIYGSAKATQEADTVLILQHDGRKKFIEVKKNRFNGGLGHAPLHFDHKTGRYSEQPLVNGFTTGPQPPATQGNPQSQGPPSASANKPAWDMYR